MVNQLYGGVEAGGTKFVCAVGTPNRILKSVTIPTTNPDDTISEALSFFRKQKIELGDLAGLGIGSFGPLDINSDSSAFGRIGKTPKSNWSDFNLMTAFAELNCPINIDTDVNAAGLAEAILGAGRNKKVVLYITVGTGIGVGVIFNSLSFRGRDHPEIGHILIQQDSQDDGFAGVCPYHGNCLEGLASGPAIEKRWGVSLSQLPIDHPAHSLQARYLSVLCMNLILSFSPDVILIGGGVMKAPGLLDNIRNNVMTLLKGYVPSVQTLDEVEALIKMPRLGNQAGIIGSLLLGERASLILLE